MNGDWYKFGSYADRLREKLKHRLASKTTHRTTINETILKVDQNQSLSELYSTTDGTSDQLSSENESNQINQNEKEENSNRQKNSSIVDDQDSWNGLITKNANETINHRNRLLSYILEQFMMSSDVYEDENEEESLTDEKIIDYTKFNFFEYKQTGSAAEKLYIPFPNHSKSDIDLMFEFPYTYAVDPEQFTPKEREQYQHTSQIGFLNIDYHNKEYPCYIKLYFDSKEELIETNEQTTSSFILPDINKHVIVKHLDQSKRRYWPSSGFINWIASKWKVDQSWEEDFEIHGPSICTATKDPELPVPMDHVPSLKCIHWPKTALNWIHRTRSVNWPSENLINLLVKYGCHIVPISHHLTSTADKQFEWRLSFSMCELILAKTLNYYQRKCFLIVKALIDVHIKQDLELSKVICSYFLKTTLYWLCESIERNQWTYETLYDRFVNFIDYLIQSFEKKCLKHYFIPEMNLIDHLENKILEKLNKKFVLIKNDVVNMIKICEEHYWNTNQFLRFQPIIEVLTSNTNLDDNSCILWCCANTMLAFIRHHKLIDAPLKMVQDCLKRNYLQSSSEESARHLLHATSLITQLFDEENTCSNENLLTHKAMIEICETKSIYDQSYEQMKENYIQIQSYLNETDSTD